MNSDTDFIVTFEVKNDINYSETDYFTIVCRNIRLPKDSFTNVPILSFVKNDGKTPI